MLLRARFVVEGFISGMHQSPFRGHSLEFAQHREYSSGDELKHMDWKVYAKSDRYYVKQYQEETNLRCYLLLDKSASMGYGSAGVSKLRYGSFIAASLSYLMIRQQDSVGLVTFDGRIRTYIPSRQSGAHLSVIMKELENISPSSDTGIGKSLNELGQYTKKRGLIIVISDLFDNEDEVLKAVKYFRFRKHEVIIFHVLDKEELDLPRGDMLLFEDMENGEKLLSRPDIIRKEYGRLMNGFIEKYKLNCRDSDIDYCLVDTSSPLDYTLGLYLAKREKVK